MNYPFKEELGRGVRFSNKVTVVEFEIGDEGEEIKEVITTKIL